MEIIKGYELYKLISEDKVKDGEKFEDNYGKIWIYKNGNFKEENNTCYLTDIFQDIEIAKMNFERKEKEEYVDIKELETIKELDNNFSIEEIVDKINDLILVAKQIDTRIDTIIEKID